MATCEPRRPTCRRDDPSDSGSTLAKLAAAMTEAGQQLDLTTPAERALLLTLAEQITAAAHAAVRQG